MAVKQRKIVLREVAMMWLRARFYEDLYEHMKIVAA